MQWKLVYLLVEKASLKRDFVKIDRAPFTYAVMEKEYGPLRGHSLMMSEFRGEGGS